MLAKSLAFSPSEVFENIKEKIVDEKDKVVDWIKNYEISQENNVNFMNYLALYNKEYFTMDEYTKRMKIFVETQKLIYNHDIVNETYELGINYFSDWTP
jgi:hypothetical protein